MLRGALRSLFARSMAAARAPRPRYSPHERSQWLALIDRLRGPVRISKTPVRRLLDGDRTPSRATWYRWRQVHRAPKPAARTMGRPPKLNKAEREVLAGRVLWRVHHPHPVTGDWVINWARQAFGVTYSRPGISKLLRSLHIRAHRTKRKRLSNAREPIRLEMINCLTRMRRAIELRADLSAVVALDEMTFTSSGAIGWSYSAVGGCEVHAEMQGKKFLTSLTSAQGPASWSVA